MIFTLHPGLIVQPPNLAMNEATQRVNKQMLMNESNLNHGFARRIVRARWNLGDRKIPSVSRKMTIPFGASPRELSTSFHSRKIALLLGLLPFIVRVNFRNCGRNVCRLITLDCRDRSKHILRRFVEKNLLEARPAFGRYAMGLLLQRARTSSSKNEPEKRPRRKF